MFFTLSYSIFLLYGLLLLAERSCEFFGQISGGVSLSFSDKTAALRILVQWVSSFSYTEKKKTTDNVPPLSFI